MKSSGHFFLVRLYPYGSVVYVSIGQSESDLARGMRGVDRRNKINVSEMVLNAEAKLERAASVNGVHYELDSYTGLLWIRKMPIDRLFEVTLLHECFHAICHCMRCAGIDLDSPSSEEAHAYLLERLWLDIMEAVKPIQKNSAHTKRILKR